MMSTLLNPFSALNYSVERDSQGVGAVRGFGTHPRDTQAVLVFQNTHYRPHNHHVALLSFGVCSQFPCSDTFQGKQSPHLLSELKVDKMGTGDRE